MQIIGRGLIAGSLLPYAEAIENSLIFASGVSNSMCLDSDAYRREVELLDHWLKYCSMKDLRMVYFSSAGAVYGRAFQGLRDEQTPCSPDTQYGRHKLACEQIIRNHGCRHLIVRLPNLVGLRQNRQQLIPALIEQALNGQAVLFRDATRDIVGVDIMAQVVMEVLSNAPDRETVVLASGISLSSLEIFDQIQSILGTNAEVDLLPRGDRQAFRIDKLKQYAPQTAHFNQLSQKRMLSSYIPILAADFLNDQGTLPIPTASPVPSSKEAVA